MSAGRHRSPTTRRRRSRHRLHPLAISALMILALAAVTYYAFTRALPFTHSFTVNATVANSVNVRSGDPVRIAGIDVGAVTAVRPAGDATRITFTVDAGTTPLHRNATVAVRDRLFLEGSYYLALDPGTPAAPAMRDEGFIPESQTSSPVQFFQVLSTFDVAARTSLTRLVAALAQGFGAPPGKPLSDSGAAGLKQVDVQLKPALRDTAVVAQALQGTQPGDVARLLTSASAVTGTLGENSRQLTGLIRGLEVSSRALAASDGNLAATVSGVDQTLRVSPAALTAVARALPPVTRLARVLTPSLKASPPLLSGLSAAVAQLAAVLSPVQRSHLLLTLRTTFRDLPTVLGGFARAFPITKQVTDCLRTHLTPLLKAVVPDGPLSTGRPVWQDFAHFLPGIGGASAGFDANGPFTRVLAGAGANVLSGGGSGLLGGLVATAPPGGTTLAGARPTWVGALTSRDFRPDVPCSSQALPSLAARTASADLGQVTTSGGPHPTRAQVMAGGRTAAGRGR